MNRRRHRWVRSTSPGRRGSALIAVLAAVVLATLVAGAAAALARTLQADVRGAAAALRARAAADGAIATVLAGWPPSWTTGLAQGASDARSVTSAAGTATVRALRLDARRFLVTADATSPALAGPLGPAVRRAALFAQLDDVSFAATAALVAAGPVALAAGTEVRAADGAPDGWGDCVATPDAAAAVAAPALDAAPGSRVLGATLTDPAAWAPPSSERFGGVGRDALAARADVVVPAGGGLAPAPRAVPNGSRGQSPNVDFACARDPASWGEPRRGAAAVAACVDDFPVVYVRGPGVTQLRGPARFQGTLVLDGGLDVVGPVDVAGVIVVGGALRAAGGALTVDGAVLVRGGGASLGPGSRVRRSRCALERAAAGASRPAPLARRAWAEVVR